MSGGTGALEVVDPRTDPRWAELVASGRGDLFSSPAWVRAVAGTYGFDVRAHLLTEGGRPAAGMVHAEVHDARGHRLVSFPFSDRCDPVVDRPAQWGALLEPLVARGLPVRVRTLAPRFAACRPGLVTTGTAAWHATDLQGTEEDLSDRLAAQARQNIRRARREGVEVRLSSGLEDVRAFHRLHCHLRKHKYRLLAQPFALFERIWAEFEPTGSLWVALAEHEGDLVAGALYLVWDGVAYYKFGASIPERLRVRPNELLAWTSLVRAQELGCRLFDWGLSDLDQPGLVAFKEKFATERGTITTSEHRPDGAEGQVGEAAGALLGELVELLTRGDVPDEVTRRAGEIAYGTFC